MLFRDNEFMSLAIAEARLALTHGDVPIGAVIVHEGEIIGRGHNRREIDNDPTAHAEMIAIRQASQALGEWRLESATLYCTLEPCCMCAGAIVLARIPRVVYGAIDEKAGCAGSIADILRHTKLNHRVDVFPACKADECSLLLSDFFQTLRKK